MQIFSLPQVNLEPVPNRITFESVTFLCPCFGEVSGLPSSIRTNTNQMSELRLHKKISAPKSIFPLPIWIQTNSARYAHILSNRSRTWHTLILHPQKVGDALSRSNKGYYGPTPRGHTRCAATPTRRPDPNSAVPCALRRTLLHDARRNSRGMERTAAGARQRNRRGSCAAHDGASRRESARRRATQVREGVASCGRRGR